MSFDIGTITEVEQTVDRIFVTTDQGWSTGFKRRKLGDFELREGQQVRTLGEFGHRVIGLEVDGTLIYQDDELTQATEKELTTARMRAKKLEQFLDRRPQLDEQYESLPEPFRRRIDRFRHAGGNEWRWNFESYEMMCCVDGAKLAEQLGTPEAVKEFAEADHEEQKQMAEFSDQHSGNSFGFALRLAWLYLTDPELVIREHGALTPLVGCEGYFCEHEASE